MLSECTINEREFTIRSHLHVILEWTTRNYRVEVSQNGGYFLEMQLTRKNETFWNNEDSWILIVTIWLYLSQFIKPNI